MNALSKLIFTDVGFPFGKEPEYKLPVCALEKEGRIDRLLLLHPDSGTMTGRIYIGQVEKIAVNMNAAFVRFGENQTGFLSLDGHSPLIIAEGQSMVTCFSEDLRSGAGILVQVVREAMKGKLPRLSGQLSLTGRYLVLWGPGHGLSASGKLDTEQKKRLTSRMKALMERHIPAETPVPTALSFGLILRTNAEGASDEALLREYIDLSEQYRQLISNGPHRTPGSLLHTPLPEHLQILRDVRQSELEEIVTDQPALLEKLKSFAGSCGKLTLYQDSLLSLSDMKRLSAVLEESLQEKVWLPGGGFLIIQQTEAFVCIDVNTGKNLTTKKKGKGSHDAAVLSLNLAAASEIARQLRLRNLSGIILIDFINLSDPAHQETLLRTFGGFLKDDPAGCQLIDMTPLGIVEVTRRKQRPSLKEELYALINKKNLT